MPHHPDTPETHTLNPASPGSGRARRAVVRSFRNLTVPLAVDDYAAIAPLRRLARSALAAWSVTEQQQDDVVLIVSELATNALLHTDGPARIHLRPHAGQIILEVTDTGAHMPNFEAGTHSAAGHGYGLTKISLVLADSVTVTSHPRCGKTITATFTIQQSAD